MSYTALIVFKKGKPSKQIEYRNAWGGAARIWNALFKAYIPKKFEHDSWICSGDDRRMWDLASRKDIPLFERAVHVFTFDRFYVLNEHFEMLRNDFIQFAEKYPAEQAVDHLPAWADWLKENQKVEAIGLYGTSVGENLWYRAKTCEHCGNSTDETEPVPLSEGTEAYDWLKSQK
jgi:hypothetical protein